ncbi:MAG: carbohydrate-binding family 9-like protein, partial [Victivallales bacterium]|nr:carbohydrate-binding family 9-like protein [Victivallales bacterium]
GVLDDGCWQRDGIRLVNKFDGKPLEPESRAWMAWDDDALYLAVEFDEPEMDKLKLTAVKRDDNAWADDAVEFFLSARGFPDEYLQIVVNADGVVFDGIKKETAPATDIDVDMPVTVKSTKLADGWQAEMKIPYDGFDEKPPKLGDVWRVNIIRNRRDGGQGGPFAFSPTMGQGHHNRFFFGEVEFTTGEKK